MPLPVLAGTAFPYPEESIRPETMASLQWLSSIGYGTGYVHGPYGLRLSADESQLIAFTTAGVGVFAADDLSLLRFIHAPTDYTPDSRFAAAGSVSRDGTRAVFLDRAGDSRVVRVLNLESGEKVGEFPYAWEGSLVGMAISLDNSLLVLAFDSGKLEVVQLPAGEPAKTISQYVGTVDRVRSLVFEPGGKLLYFLFHDIDIGVQSVGFDTASWAVKSFHSVEGTEFDYTYGVFAPTRSEGSGFRYGYFTSGWSPEIRAYDYEKLGPRFDIPLKAPVSTIGVSNNSQWIATGNAYSDQVDVWKLEQIKGPEMTFPGHGNMIWGAAVTNDGQTVYSVGWDGLLRKWKAGSDVPEREVSGFYPIINNIVFAHESDNLLLSTNVGSIFEVDARTGVLLRTFADSREARRRYWQRPSDGHHHEFAQEVEDLNEGNIFGCLASLSMDDLLVAQSCHRYTTPTVLWTYPEAQVTRTIPPVPENAWNTVVALSPDGRWLARTTVFSRGTEMATRLIDLDGQEAVRVLDEGKQPDAMVFSPDSRLLAIAAEAYESPVRVFDVGTGDLIQEIAIVTPYGGGASDVAFSADGDLLIALDYSQGLQVFDTRTWTQVASKEPIGDGSALVMTLAAESPLVAMGTSFNQVFLWDHEKDALSPPVELPGDSGVEDAVFSRDDRLLAVLRSDGVVYVLGIEP